MATEIKMPQLSDTMDQGKILTWFKKVGDKVSRGTALAEVETDKANLEIECFAEGVLLEILAPAGEMVKVGSVIAVVGEAGEVVGVVKDSVGPRDTRPTSTSGPTKSEEVHVDVGRVSRGPTNPDSDDRIKISPLARNVAKAKGIDVSTLSGSGEGGRITKKDVEQSTPTRPVGGGFHPPQPQDSHVDVVPRETRHLQTEVGVPLSKMRQAIAARMTESVTTIPHFYMTTKVVMEKIAELRETLKALPQYKQLTYNHFFIKGVAIALRNVPRINASYKDGKMIEPADVNIGVVTALDDGLMIPVVKQADVTPLAEIVADTNAMIERARSGKPKSDDLMGATFSISNVGRYDVEAFTAVISPGQGAILAVGAIAEDVVVEDGEISTARVVRVTLSVDHRIIDGVVGAEFLTELKRVLENPVLLLA